MNKIHCECESINEYISYEPGDGSINLIITAPHNGELRPSCIWSRTAGCYINRKCVYNHICGRKSYSKCRASTSGDLGTKDMAIKIRNRIVENFGVKPHSIINNLHRTKLDANRAKSEAAFGELYAKWAFDLYQQY